MNIVEPAFGVIPMDLIRASKTNPRKRFDETSLAELAKSIEQHGVMQPILVRPLENIEEDVQDRVEIVCGERRFRAAKLAGLATIPAIVRDMSDREVQELQLVENLQREDVHPIEEAEGYQRLMAEHGYNADQLAEKVGKSRSYIYGRLKFGALVPEARTAFFDGKLNASTALLVARIPIDKLQVQAAKEITGGMSGMSEPLSYRAAVQLIKSRYMLDLRTAPFAIVDATLVPKAGSCDACPKRCGNQPEIYADIDNADLCTDPDCFGWKKVAQEERLVQEAQQKGIPVYSDDDDEAGDVDGIALSTYAYNFERLADDVGRYKSVEELLPHDARPDPKALIKGADGAVTPLYEKTAIQEALEKAGLARTLEKHTEAIKEKLGKSDKGLSERQAREAAEKDAKEKKAAAECAYRLALYSAIRGQVQADPEKHLVALRAIAKTVTREWSFPSELANLYEFKVNDPAASGEFIDSASADQIQTMMLDMVVGSALSVHYWEVSDDRHLEEEDYLDLLGLAGACDIDAAAMRAEMIPAQAAAAGPEQEQPAAKKARKAKKVEAKPAADQADPDPASDASAGDQVDAETDEPAIGDRVRVKDDAKGPNGKKRKVAGKEGTVTGIKGEHYIVQFGANAREIVSNLVRDELERPAAAEKHASPIIPLDAWPFPTGARP